MRTSTTVWPLLLSLLSVSCSAKLSFSAGKASVSSVDSTTARSLSLDPSKPEQALSVAPDETLKLTFTVFDDATADQVKPHQTFLRFHDEETDEEGIVPVKVSKDGKAKFSMNLRRPPTGLPPTGTNPLKVSLILGSFTYEPAVYSLFDLTLPPSGTVPPHPEESTFHSLPEIAHTFRAEEKLPYKVISLVFTGAVLAPWLVLFSLLSQLPLSLKPTGRTLPFLGLLAAFEGLLFWYWVDLYLGQVLMYGAALGVVTAVAGRRALSSS